MAAKRRGLGSRDLDALLGSSDSGRDEDNDSELKTLPVSEIQAGTYQPRRHWDEQALEELAASIRAQGLIQPVVVREVGKRRYELIAGERRWRASQMAGLNAIPALVKQVSASAAPAMALIEWKWRGGHARALLTRAQARARKLAGEAVAKGWSVRQLEQAARKPSGSKSRRRSNASRDADIVALERELSEALATEVSVQHSSGGSGKLVIRYHDADQLEGVLERLRSGQ